MENNVKKAMQNNDQTWYCSKCKATFFNCSYKYIFQLKLVDHIGTSCSIDFEEPTTNLLGMSAKDLYMLHFN